MAPVDAAELDQPPSPTSPKQHVSEETLTLQVQEFLDGWEFRIMRSSLAKKWKREKAVSTALELMALNGVPLSRDAIDRMSQADERQLAGLLAEQIPPPMWDNFEILASELMVMLNTMCRVRSAVDDGEEEIETMMEEEAETDTMMQRIMKESVVAASKEVARLSHCGASWSASTEKRLERLESFARYAEYTRQQLMAVENQLESFTASQSSKNKTALLGLAQGNDRALQKSVFSNWLGICVATKAEREIRQRYESELREAEARLYAYMEKRLSGVKDALMRKVREGDRGLVDLCLSSWYDVVQRIKKDGDTKAELQKMQDKMKEFKGEAKERQMKVMGRMMADNDEAATLLAWSTWVAFHEDYQKDKETEEAAKKLEQALANQKNAKKEEAQKVLDRLGGATDSGLMAQALRSWVSVIAENRKTKRMTVAMDQQDVRLKLMLNSQKTSAHQVIRRTNDQVHQNLLLRVICAWMLETKVMHVEKHYKLRIDSKRDQLRKVQSLFQKFARELEEGLSNVDGDSSGRTQTRRSKAMLRGDAAVSLPGIHPHGRA